MRKFLILVLAMCFPLVIGCELSKDKAASFPQEPENAARLLFEDGTYAINAKASSLYWQAFKVGGGHSGGISLERGEFIVQNGQPQSGSFIIDMTSISNSDIENEGLRKNLVNHLKSDDFFSVEDYPTARFDITRILPYEGKGDYNFTIEGDLSLKNVTQPVTVLAKIQQNGEKLSAYGRAEVDRTKFGITIRSGSFFENLGDQLIKDIFVLEMELSADRV